MRWKSDGGVELGFSERVGELENDKRKWKVEKKSLKASRGNEKIDGGIQWRCG